MSTNYHWHKQQANARVQARLREAEEHRRAKQANGLSTSSFVLRLIPVLVGVIVAIWLLTGCAASNDLRESKEIAVTPETGLTMADRIRFQDEREAILETDSQIPQLAGRSMTDRIRFQDERDSRLRNGTVREQQAVWTMVERIRFHDALWERSSSRVR